MLCPNEICLGFHRAGIPPQYDGSHLRDRQGSSNALAYSFTLLPSASLLQKPPKEESQHGGVGGDVGNFVNLSFQRHFIPSEFPSSPPASPEGALGSRPACHCKARAGRWRAGYDCFLNTHATDSQVSEVGDQRSGTKGQATSDLASEYFLCLLPEQINSGEIPTLSATTAIRSSMVRLGLYFFSSSLSDSWSTAPTPVK